MWLEKGGQQGEEKNGILEAIKTGPGGALQQWQDFSLGLDEERGRGRDLSQSINSWALIIQTYFECYTRDALLRFAWRPTGLGE